VLLGTDYPFDMGVDNPLQRLAAADALPAAYRDAIAGGNAVTLFGLGTEVPPPAAGDLASAAS
jgi:aminocarboxymuconate-semialdehyde decarboxylase